MSTIEPNDGAVSHAILGPMGWLSLDDLGDLSSATDSGNGAFFWLLDCDTGFGHNPAEGARHPWIFPDGYRPNSRRALNVAMPRSTSKPLNETQRDRSVAHAPHRPHAGEPCDLDCDGWIYGQQARPVKREWVRPDSRICHEPDKTVLAAVQALAIECS